MLHSSVPFLSCRPAAVTGQASWESAAVSGSTGAARGGTEAQVSVVLPAPTGGHTAAGLLW